MVTLVGAGSGTPGDPIPPYSSSAERNLLRQALSEAVHLPQRDARPGISARAPSCAVDASPIAEAVAAFAAQKPQRPEAGG